MDQGTEVLLAGVGILEVVRTYKHFCQTLISRIYELFKTCYSF